MRQTVRSAVVFAGHSQNVLWIYVQHQQADIASISMRWLKGGSLTLTPFSVINLTVFLNPCQVG